MEALQHEQYEYARKRIRQKKNVFFHFIFFVTGSFFLMLINKVLKVGQPESWWKWAALAWMFIFVLHFIKVFVTDSFMNKNWERHQIDKLVAMQQRRMQKIQAELDAEKENEA